MHLAVIHKLVSEFKPDVVIVDPMSTLLHAGTPSRLRDYVLDERGLRLGDEKGGEDGVGDRSSVTRRTKATTSRKTSRIRK